MNHTPTPWKAQIQHFDRYHKIEGADNSTVAQIPDWFDESPEESKANAAFIVTACNEYYENKRKADAHEDLVEALEAASRIELLRNDLSENYARLNERKGTVESIQTSKANVTRLNAELSKIRTQIKEALAKAGVRQ